MKLPLELIEELESLQNEYPMSLRIDVSENGQWAFQVGKAAPMRFPPSQVTLVEVAHD